MSRFVRTFKARKIYLDQLAAGNSESMAAEAAGGTVRNFKAWRAQDEAFHQDYLDAIEAGTDFIEDVAVQRALTKSDALMAMILKARRPDKYDRGSKLELSGGISVEGAKSKLLNKIARLQAAGQLPAGGADEVPEIPEAEGAEVHSAPKLLPPPNTDAASIRGRKRRAAAEGSGRATAA